MGRADAHAPPRVLVDSMLGKLIDAAEADLPVPPWTKPGHPDYSWDPAARPAIPAEVSEDQVGTLDSS